MKIIKISALMLSIGLFLTACNEDQTQQVAESVPYGNNAAESELLTDTMENEYWAKDNLDLQRLGPLLERSDDPREFESLINSNDGINNLDLNGDGYVDYISVDEFEDRGPNERGLSLFTRFGPDLIQEVAQIIFYRDDLNSPGSRVLLMGNEQLYGDNRYYETNWLDRSIGLVGTLFSDRDQYYRSPYYYDNYPPDYVTYEVVETPIYRTRIEQMYPEPVFVYTPAPTFISNVKIKSPHKDKKLDKIHAKLAKPTKEQESFIKSDPTRVLRVKENKGEKEIKAEKRDDKGGERQKPAEKAAAREDKPDKAQKAQAEKGSDAKPPKAEKPNDKPQKQGGEVKSQGKAEGKGQDKGKKP